MVLSFTSSTPAAGATDFFLNKSIEVTFNEELSDTTLSNNSVFIIDVAGNSTVDVSISKKPSDANTIILTPTVNLKENSTFRLYLVGTSEGLGYELAATNGDLLTNTVIILFSTGNNLYQIDTLVEKQAANLTLEGDLFLPTNVKALGYDFTIDKVRPKNHTHGVATTLTGDNTIRFTFTKALLTGQDYTEWANIDAYSLLNYDGYLASGTELNAVAQSNYTIPGYTLAVTGQDFLVTFTGELPKNAGIAIKLTNKIEAADGSQYGGDMDYVINTELYPAICGVESVRREIRPVSVDFYDDFIGSLLFKNTMQLWEKVGRFSLDLNTHPLRLYILSATVLDIIGDKEYEKFVLAGTRRQLGDLNVSVDNLIGRLAMKAAKLEKDKEIALETIKRGWQFKLGQYPPSDAAASRRWWDINGRYTDTSYRYYQQNVPAANSSLNRHAKTNNPWWW